MDEILDEKTYESRKLKYATVSQRFIAFCIDLILILAVSFSIYEFIKIWYLHLIAFIFYFTVLEGGESQATVGKQLMNIRVLNENKLDLSYTISAKRIVFSILLMFGFYQIFNSEKNQTMADRYCNVLIILIK
jgi:uncharacterized RDD family membrane protein YckC